MNPDRPICDDGKLWDVWLSVQWMPSLALADEFGLFEALAERPASAAELAERLGLALRGVEALLPMLAALGFLVPRLGRYQVTEVARTYLLSASPFYWGGILASGRQGMTATWIRDALRPPADQGERGLPSDAWASGQLSPDRARGIARYMHAQSLPAAIGLARSVDFRGVSRLLDIGGGSGCFSIELVRRNPSLHCTVMELPAMCDLVHEYVAEAGVTGRVDTVSVDMLREAWPLGYDAMFFSNIFHDWDVETNIKLATSACAALPSGGRIYLHEALLDDAGGGPLIAAAFSVLMLGTQGRQYRFAELKEMLERAGFAEIETASMHGPYSLVVGRKT